MCLDRAFFPIRTFTVFLVGPMGTVHVPPNSTKHRFLGEFGFHSTIHTFKNYLLSVISFQFLTNKWYLNIPLTVATPLRGQGVLGNTLP